MPAATYNGFVVDLHTRRLRYFVAVAEELHFGRAGARFFVAQQAMSRQIRELEAELGTALFLRTTRTVRLTPAGEELLAAARTILETLDAGVLAAQRASRTSVGQLTVGFRFGVALELTEPLLTAVGEEHPGITIELRELEYSDPARACSQGKVDVAILRGPVTGSSLHFVPLYSEPLVVAVAHRHPFARRASVPVTELAAVTIAAAESQDQVWHRFWTLEDVLGHTPERLINAGSLTEELELVAAGVACAINVAAAKRYLPHPGVTYVPIDAASRCTTGLAWEPERETPLVRDFVSTALAVRDREAAVVQFIEDPFGSAPPPQ
jgi:DNA-binding transcriptional LysR family regulator